VSAGPSCWNELLVLLQLLVCCSSCCCCCSATFCVTRMLCFSLLKALTVGRLHRTRCGCARLGEQCNWANDHTSLATRYDETMLLWICTLSNPLLISELYYLCFPQLCDESVQIQSVDIQPKAFLTSGQGRLGDSKRSKCAMIVSSVCITANLVLANFFFP
jgi:hypothetical protein